MFNVHNRCWCQSTRCSMHAVPHSPPLTGRRFFRIFYMKYLLWRQLLIYLYIYIFFFFGKTNNCFEARTRCDNFLFVHMSMYQPGLTSPPSLIIVVGLPEGSQVGCSRWGHSSQSLCWTAANMSLHCLMLIILCPPQKWYSTSIKGFRLFCHVTWSSQTRLWCHLDVARTDSCGPGCWQCFIHSLWFCVPSRKFGEFL